MSTTPNTTTEHKPEPSSAAPPSNPVSLLEAATFFAIDYIDLCQQANISLTQLAETLDDPAYQPTLEKLRRLKKLEQRRYQEVITREAIENLRRISLSHPDPTERRRASSTILRAFATTNRPRHKSKSPPPPDALRPQSGSASNHTNSQSNPSHQSHPASTQKEEVAGGNILLPKQSDSNPTPAPQNRPDETLKEETEEESAGGNFLLRKHTDSTPTPVLQDQTDGPEEHSHTTQSKKPEQKITEANTLPDKPSNADIAELRSKAGTTKPLTKPAPLDDTLPLILPILETLKDANTAAQAMESLHALLTPEQKRIYQDPADYFATHLDLLKAFSTTKAVTPTPKHHPALIRDGEDATRNFQIQTPEGDHTLEITFIHTATTDPPWHITTITLKPPSAPQPTPAHQTGHTQTNPTSRNDTS